MARLTLEALEERDLLSANPLTQTIAPPAPVAHVTIYDAMITTFSAPHQAARFVIDMDDIIITN